MAELVCKKCLNPAYKKGLCVEHYVSWDYNPDIEGFVIRGESVYFEKVKAFKVFEVDGCPDEREIRIAGNIYDDYVEMKRLLNVHFRNCRLLYVKLIRGNEIARFDDFVKSLSCYPSHYMDASMNLYCERGEVVGILVEIEDAEHTNIYGWYRDIHRMIDKVKSKVAKWLISYDFDKSQGLVS